MEECKVGKKGIKRKMEWQFKKKGKEELERV
jgi:hypothetical protein